MNPSKRLLGIGNPLLDISVVVDQAFLDKYHKISGNAVLAEEKDLPLYTEIQAFKDVLYIAGGSTQNSIRGAQWMSPEKGVTHYIGSVGNDDNAAKLKAAATVDGVQTHYYVSKTHRTGSCAVLIKDNDRSLVADLAAANDYQHEHYLSDEIQTLIKSIDVFYSAGFFLTVSPQTVVEIGKHCVENNKILVWCVAAPFIAEFFF
jgi:adenosine kinase